MKKAIKTVILILALGLCFVLGLEADVFRDAWLERSAPGESAEQSAAAPVLRVYDGQLQWFDGARWQLLGDAEDLADADPIAAAGKLAEQQAAAAAAAESEGEAAGKAEEDAEEETETVIGGNRGVGSVFGGYGGWDGGGGGGGGYSGGGGGGGSDGQDIAWSSDYL